MAGGSWQFRGDGKPAIDAPLGFIEKITVDLDGNVFAADPGNHMVVKISPSGVLAVVAGNGIGGFSGDGGPATSAGISAEDVAVDANGNLYIADSGSDRIRKVGLRRPTRRCPRPGESSSP